jgi:hypothetical protein
LSASKSHLIAFAAGSVTLTFCMFLSAIQVGSDFAPAQVVAAGLGYLFILAAMAIASGVRPKLRLPTLKASSIQMFIGAAFGLLVFWRISQEHPFLRYYQPHALKNLDSGIPFHQDTAFHSALIQSILSFGYPSTAQHGAPVTFYYALSHYLDAFACWVSSMAPYQSAAVFFEFKKLLLVLAIGCFVMLATRDKSAVFRFGAMFVSVPVFIGTWSAIGSEGLWSASILLLLAASKLIELLKRPRLGWRQFGFIVVMVCLVSGAKLSSGVMLAAVLGPLLIQRHFKNYWLWLSAAALATFFGAAALLFSSSNKVSEPRGFSLSDSINFLNFTTQEQSVDYLIGIYAVLALTTIFAGLIRSQMLSQLLIANSAATLVLSALASHFNKSDQYYFSFGLLNALLVFSIPLLFESINPRWQLRTLGAWVLAATMFASAFFMPQSYEHVFGLSKEQIAAQRLDKFTVRATSLESFEKALNRYLIENHLNKRESLLFVPKWMFKNRKMQFKGQTWAHGLLLYAVTGVPLWHGSPEIHDGYGFGNYSAADTWVNNDNDGMAQQCSMGKKVIRVRSFSEPTFQLVCKN